MKRPAHAPLQPLTLTAKPTARYMNRTVRVWPTDVSIFWFHSLAIVMVGDEVRAVAVHAHGSVCVG